MNQDDTLTNEELTAAVRMLQQANASLWERLRQLENHTHTTPELLEPVSPPRAYPPLEKRGQAQSPLPSRLVT